MKKATVFKVISIVFCVICIISSIVIWLIYKDHKSYDLSKYRDGVTVVDPNTIVLSDSGVRVSFSEVILSKPNETRKLVVFEQEGTVSYTIEDRMFSFLDAESTKKYQTVKYTGKGSFIVELDELTAANIIDDSENKVLTIKIPHPRLDTIDIDPNKVEIGEQTTGFWAIGTIKLTLSDYNIIETELRDRLVEKFNTTANGQEADDLALDAVYAIYAPIVEAVDSDYELKIVFQ